MTTLTTKLVPDGNSMAVRLPKHVLTMSGLNGVVKLSVKHGQITLRSSQNPREGWGEQIKREIAANGLPTIVDYYSTTSAKKRLNKVNTGT